MLKWLISTLTWVACRPGRFDKQSVMKILYLSPWYPYPPDNGAKTRVYNLLNILAKKYEVIFIAFSPMGTDNNQLNICSRVLTIKQDPFLKPRILKSFHFFLPYPIVTYKNKEMSHLVNSILQTNKISVAIAFTSYMAPYLTHAKVPKVFDIDASLTSYGLERLRLERSTFSKLRAWLSLQKSINFEKKMANLYDTTIVLTEINLKSLTSVLSKAKRLAIIGNGVDPIYYSLNCDLPESNTLIYNGALTFSANYDAMKWFLNDIFPLIKAEIPGVTMKVTGSLDGVNTESLPINENVILTGYVQDIRPVVSRSWACIVPLRFGSGQRMKILEAMALGIPVVSTSKGVEGLDVIDEKHLLIADTPKNFAMKTVRLLREPKLRSFLTRNARDLIERKYNWLNIGECFCNIVENCCL